MKILNEKETLNYVGGIKVTASFGLAIVGIISFIYGIVEGFASTASSCRR